jgi:serine/threonine protein kinase
MSAPLDDVKAIFEHALGLPDPAKRSAYVEEACGGNATLRAEVMELLEATDRAGRFLNRGPLQAGATGALTSPSPHESVPSSAPATDTFDSDPPTSSSPGPEESVGTVIAGKYKLIEVIGEGGMGTVFLTQQTEPVKRLVALKVMKSGMDSRAVLARFEAERQALAMMDHPNIAQVLDAGTTGRGRPYFVMELVKGVPITKFCDERKLTPNERLEIFVPVCQAIQHAHQKGVIHRDLKPSNVLVAMYDDRPVPKVIDFGVAKATGVQLTEHTLVTGFGAIVGTPEYMSPEQVSFNQMDVDTRSDIYALGVLLYELLTGAPPFSRKQLEKAGLLEVFRMIREQEPPRPSTRLSTSEGLPTLAANRRTEPRRLTALVKGELDWIVMKALEKNRSRRYETANGFAADIQRYLAGETVQAVPPSAGYRLRKFLGKHRGPVTAVVIVVLALVAGIVGTTLALIRAEAAKRAEKEERVRMEQERDAKEKARQEAVEQRKLAEYQAASFGIDLDMEGAPQPKIELLRLARRLPTIPDHAPELREFVIRRVLALGHEIRPFIPPNSELSPDGRHYLKPDSGICTLCEVLTGRHIAFWHGDGTFVAGGRLILRTERDGNRLCDTSGRVVMTLPTEQRIAEPPPNWNWYPGGSLGIRRSVPPLVNYPTIIEVSPDGKRVLIEMPSGSALLTTEFEFQLLDIESSKLVARLPAHKVNSFRPTFGPDGATLLTVTDGVFRVWSADGRLIAELGRFRDQLHDVAFSPNGRLVAALEGQGDDKQLRLWQVAPGTTMGPPIPVPKTQSGLILWLDDETPGVDLDPAEETFVPGHGTVPAQIVRVRGNLALSSTGAILDLRTGRRIAPARNKRFPPEAAQFAIEGRFFITRDRVFDLVVEKPLKLTVNSYLNLSRHVQSARILWVFESGVTGQGIRGNIGVPLHPLPSAESLALWAGVTARGELDETGAFVPWDERKWMAQKQALVGADSEQRSTFFDPVLRDAQFWLRREIEELDPGATNRGPDNPALLKVRPLLERLVTAEPTWENYADLAFFYYRTEQYALASRAILDATQRAGVVVDTFHHFPNLAWDIGKQAGLPREHYELAIRWQRAARAEAPPGTVPMCLYRLGRYADALAELRIEEEKDFPARVARMVLTGASWSAIPLHDVAALRHPDNQPPALTEMNCPGLRAMCHHKLGQPVLASKYLARAAVEQKREDERKASAFQPPREYIPFYREAAELITGTTP